VVKQRVIAEDPGRQYEHELAPAWLSVPEACMYIGMKSVAYFYKQVMPRVTVKKHGRLTRVKRTSLDEYMDKLPAQPPEGLRSRHGAVKPRAG